MQCLIGANSRFFLKHIVTMTSKLCLYSAQACHIIAHYQTTKFFQFFTNVRYHNTNKVIFCGKALPYIDNSINTKRIIRRQLHRKTPHLLKPCTQVHRRLESIEFHEKHKQWNRTFYQIKLFLLNRCQELTPFQICFDLNLVVF